MRASRLFSTLLRAVPVALVVAYANLDRWPAVWADLHNPVHAVAETLAIVVVVGGLIILLRPSWRRSGLRLGLRRDELRKDIGPDAGP